MSVETIVVCDACGEVIEDETKRCQIEVSEYVEPIGGRYVVPTFRHIHLHYPCYEATLREQINRTDT